MSVAERTQGPAPIGSGLEPPSRSAVLLGTLAARLDGLAGSAFLMPAVLVVLFLFIFPLIISIYISLVRLQFVPGGFELTFVGLNNYRKLLVELDHVHFLGLEGAPTLLGWIILGLVVISQVIFVSEYIRTKRISPIGLVGRILVAAG